MKPSSAPVPSLKRYHPLPLRLWHWTNMLVIFGLLATFVLRKTFLSYRTNAALIESKAAAAGITIPADLAKTMARSIRDEMWSWHYPLGFALCFLMLFRIFWVMKTGQCPRKEAWNAWKSGAKEVALARTGQVGFYLSAVIMSVSGLLMYFSKELGISKDLNSTIQEVHETVLWAIIVFIVAHVAGVIRAELTAHRGLVSDMIHGGDR